MFAYVETGMNLVDVRDVAAAQARACEGPSGEKYILGHTNLTLKQIFDLLSRVTEFLLQPIEYHTGLRSLCPVEMFGRQDPCREPSVPLKGLGFRAINVV
jgi:dihydroflavonol-4-reductase